MKRLVFECWILLLYFDLVFRFRSFPALHRIVRESTVHPSISDKHTPAEISEAADIASVYYFKPVLCLQRSAATTILLRRYGWKAELVIGARTFPIRSHAWVEIANKVVNDKPYMLDIYQVLERC